MTIRDIVKQWLDVKGYDGLYCPGECGCETKDLFPCSGEGAIDCKPGYKAEGCTCGCGCPWHIVEQKPLPSRKSDKGT